MGSPIQYISKTPQVGGGIILEPEGGTLGVSSLFGSVGGIFTTSNVYEAVYAVPALSPVSYTIQSVTPEYIDEGVVATILVHVVNSSETIYWTINGTTADFDSVSGSSTYSSTIVNEAAADVTYVHEITFNTIADNLSEGGEEFTFSLRVASITGEVQATNIFEVFDTSTTSGFIISSFSDTTPNEGTTVTVNFYSLNSAETMYWSINGTTADFGAINGSSNYSNVTVVNFDTRYNHTITFTVNADYLSEGNESFTLSLRTNSISGTVVATHAFTVQDTSKVSGWAITAMTDTTPNEGTSPTITYYTLNSTETLYWTVNGTTADFTAISGSSNYSSTQVVGNDTRYIHVKPISIKNDLSTEGNESFTFSLRTAGTGGTVRATQTFTVQDTSVTPEITPFLSIGLTLVSSPNPTVRVFKQNIDAFSEVLPTITPIPSTNVTTITTGLASQYLFVGSNQGATGFRVYKRNFGTFTEIVLDPLAGPTAIGGSAYANNTLVIATSTQANLYLRSGDTFTKQAALFSSHPTLSSIGHAASLTPDASHVIMSGAGTPGLRFGYRSGNAYILATSPSVLNYGSQFSPDGIYIACPMNSANINQYNLTILKRTGNTLATLFTYKLGIIANCKSATWAPNGTYLAITATVSPYLFIFKRVGNTFTVLPTPTGGLPTSSSTATQNALAFSADSNYLAHAGMLGGITIYKRTGDVFNKIAASGIPAGVGNVMTVSFSSTT